jgi:hypothetical protein
MSLKKLYQREWKDAPRGAIGERVERAEGQAHVPLAGGDRVADVNGADRFDLENRIKVRFVKVGLVRLGFNLNLNRNQNAILVFFFNFSEPLINFIT